MSRRLRDPERENSSLKNEITRLKREKIQLERQANRLKTEKQALQLAFANELQLIEKALEEAIRKTDQANLVLDDTGKVTCKQRLNDLIEKSDLELAERDKIIQQYRKELADRDRDLADNRQECEQGLKKLEGCEIDLKRCRATRATSSAIASPTVQIVSKTECQEKQKLKECQTEMENVLKLWDETRKGLENKHAQEIKRLEEEKEELNQELYSSQGEVAVNEATTQSYFSSITMLQKELKAARYTFAAELAQLNSQWQENIETLKREGLQGLDVADKLQQLEVELRLCQAARPITDDIDALITKLLAENRRCRIALNAK